MSRCRTARNPASQSPTSRFLTMTSSEQPWGSAAHVYMPYGAKLPASELLATAYVSHRHVSPSSSALMPSNCRQTSTKDIAASSTRGKYDPVTCTTNASFAPDAMYRSQCLPIRACLITGGCSSHRTRPGRLRHRARRTTGRRLLARAATRHSTNPTPSSTTSSRRKSVARGAVSSAGTSTPGSASDRTCPWKARRRYWKNA